MEDSEKSWEQSAKEHEELSNEVCRALLDIASSKTDVAKKMLILGLAPDVVKDVTRLSDEDLAGMEKLLDFYRAHTHIFKHKP